ncbi:protein-export membrane protein SecF [Paenibacillus curdlanolyticus YK9]|uniref:Protein-export membrane protein SecF n=1 Tax=Paenibacillus curdlanolyticus YK9 TaxID=717606 RepID=E0IDY3_9BACL|nr:protein translocase subunit SecF [Paenibacillus curdlanolyticus]EFM09337.1 protein-export membrane protein SecF [Paenibacillus curdlanolyticus YK9]
MHYNDKFHTNIRFDFIKHQKKFFGASLALVVLGIVSLLVFGLNYGVDFKAGTNMDIEIGKAVTQEQAKELLGTLGYKDLAPTVGGASNQRLSVRFDEVLEQPKVTEILNALKKQYGDQVSAEVNVVSPDMARELGVKTIYAVIIASVAIMIYVAIRFEWRFALAANIAILYDAFVVVALFSIFRLEVDLPFIAAVLTTIGYSINDKIVIFDRIRENLRFSKTKNKEQLAEMVNASLWQTMARNVYTVLTVLIVAISLYLFGSESIKLFALAKIIGLTSGAYSSVCIASPLWLMLRGKQKPKQTAKTSAAS